MFEWILFKFLDGLLGVVNIIDFSSYLFKTYERSSSSESLSLTSQIVLLEGIFLPELVYKRLKVRD
jgi:hypothetical protein